MIFFLGEFLFFFFGFGDKGGCGFWGFGFFIGLGMMI